ncbi:TetR/AcrR family transcriptional regulator [Aurantimonas sp. VKM B-3413]|uniref:TetR/AcrR family transcriptional regulator n=1 Tax=Aurantimonas sp. VKM B-3413 TaxID=2779401 RepID=UPI001E3D7CC2|nr:TetR/AcrR family transcriptional regulator [Aurantimonas sp. VKM B-3413]MCB8839269.1 TetR/AcrR family transcriptional regulator [Aurantimonas sp. VKM B-3413]
MSARSASRPGGRSARVQAAVHAATRSLMEEAGRGELTIPAIAERAKVTPSTIYRRWGDLSELLADVAMERIRPDGEPQDTGSAKGDLSAWAEQYAEEMASDVGREMFRDILASRSDVNNASKCCDIVRRQMETFAARAAQRAESFPDPETVIDRVVAPIVYRILFAEPPSQDYCRALVEELFTQGEAGLAASAPVRLAARA